MPAPTACGPAPPCRCDSVRYNDNKKIELTDKTHYSLYFRAEEAGNVYIGKTDKEVEEHDKEHGPGHAPNILPGASGGKINCPVLFRRLALLVLPPYSLYI
jgi:hypothetical protein